MIEGIVGLFVILFLILVIPYIKDFLYKEKTTTSVKVFPDTMVLHQHGDVWLDRTTGQTYIYDQKDNCWKYADTTPKNPRVGDIWYS